MENVVAAEVHSDPGLMTDPRLRIVHSWSSILADRIDRTGKGMRCGGRDFGCHMAG